MIECTAIELVKAGISSLVQVDSMLARQPEGLGSSPIDYEQKENLLKIRDMKKQDKMIKSQVGRGIRPLEVDAYTNPTLAPTSESLVAQYNW